MAINLRKGCSRTIPRLFLTPDQLVGIAVASQRVPYRSCREWIQLLNAHKGHRWAGKSVDRGGASSLQQLPVDLAGAHDHTLHRVQVLCYFIVLQHRLETRAAGQLAQIRLAQPVPKHRLGRENHKWDSRVPRHLPAKRMKVVCRCRTIYDSDVSSGALLQKALGTRTAVVGAGTIMTMR